MASFDDFNLWKKDRLQVFLKVRGIPTTGKKAELVALAYGASFFDIPKTLTPKEEEKSRSDRYRVLLTVVDGKVLPDPFTDLSAGWTGETQGISLWPPTMYGDISEYLVDKNERDLRTRLLTDYKDGKGFSYFDSKWLKEVFYHHVSEESDYCFLKSKCCPSMKITHEPHDVWVCINKRTGKIQSGYCSCFAG